ncbi:hypothetical protein [Haliscomenobacter sp.]|uniref:hypothetical protein n=1 Tax=Haliscomenobacter sp. TaxID=2717303 RepID=UPI003BACDB02
MDMKIEDWAMKRDWVALTHAEQTQVLAKMSREEYQHLHQRMQGIKALDVEVQPPAQLRARLMDQLAVQEKMGSPKVWWKRQIPLWQAAAAILLGVLSTFWISRSEPKVIEPRVVQVRDTLLQEKLVWKEKIVQKTVVVYRDRDSVQVAPNGPKGVSLEDAPELLGLFTQAEK